MKKFIYVYFFVISYSISFAQYNLLHEFAGGVNDGKYPYYTQFALDGTTLYGMTRFGGDLDIGTIFKIQTDGSGFTLLHEFAGGVNDGSHPWGSLILSGSTLYGMTVYGGDNELGTIFKIQTDGSGFTLLHEFAGGVNDGSHPYGSLILSGSTLFGMNYDGGDNNLGTIFKIQTDGSGFTLLREFAGGANDGSRPFGSLILSGTTLYGMTNTGGDNDLGTIFHLQTDGSGFTLLHEFAGGSNDGSRPYGSLILTGSTILGMTNNGGDNSVGTIFKIQTDGSGFTLLHEFVGGANDGQLPFGNIILSGSILYGLTRNGGDNNLGTIFQIQIDGSGFTIHHEFTGGTDGTEPYGSLILSSSTLYGMTNDGGDNNLGVIFSYEIAQEPTVTTSSITNILNNSVVTGGNVTSDGGATVTARGVCWSTNPNPTTANSHTSNGTGTGAFTSSITGLTLGTTYYVRAYATNSVGTSYGSSASFTTTRMPTVFTVGVTNIDFTTATISGNVTSDNGYTVTEKGICWGTSSYPTTTGSHVSYSNGGTGSYSCNLSNLNSSTLYHVRAYAINTQGTAYGSDITFVTVPSLPEWGLIILITLSAGLGGFWVFRKFV